MRVRRGFVEVAEGQVHYRTAGEGGVPLVMLHASPGSALSLVPLIRAFGETRLVVATDTLGNGDSSAPASVDADIAYFAGGHVRALDALGVGAFDLYGSHTGANIACEIAIAHPGRVRRLILDGISLYGAEERADMLAHYAPGVAIDLNGSQFQWVWTFVRDVYLFWPWYRREAANRRGLGLPSADDLHDKVVEVLKAVRTYHIPYRAAIGYDKAARLGLVRTPTLLACERTDMFMAYFDAVRALMPGARALVTDGAGSAGTVAAFVAFLDEELEAHPVSRPEPA